MPDRKGKEIINIQKGEIVKQTIQEFTDTGEYRKLGGLVSSFANGYYETTRVPIVGVSCSEGTTQIVEWNVGGSVLR